MDMFKSVGLSKNDVRIRFKFDKIATFGPTRLVSNFYIVFYIE